MVLVIIVPIVIIICFIITRESSGEIPKYVPRDPNTTFRGKPRSPFILLVLLIPIALIIMRITIVENAEQKNYVLSYLHGRYPNVEFTLLSEIKDPDNKNFKFGYTAYPANNPDLIFEISFENPNSTTDDTLSKPISHNEPEYIDDFKDAILSYAGNKYTLTPLSINENNLEETALKVIAIDAAIKEEFKTYHINASGYFPNLKLLIQTPNMLIYHNFSIENSNHQNIIQELRNCLYNIDIPDSEIISKS
jgi:hypothetical protein